MTTKVGGDLFGGDDDGSSAGEEEWGGDDWQADISTGLAAAGGQAEAASAPAPTTELARQESAEAGRALFVRAVSGEEDSESKGEGAVGGAAGGSSAGPRKTAPVDERVLLRGIYEALGGPEHWSRKWDLDQPVNTLHGVTCDERGRVVKIDLLSQWDSVRGDLSKVKWPAALQALYLNDCRQITGDLSKVQWPEALAELRLADTKVAGDLSKVQWPAALQSLNLDACWNIEARSSGPQHFGISICVRARGSRHHCSNADSGAPFIQLFEEICLSHPRQPNPDGRGVCEIQWPAALQTLNLSGGGVIGGMKITAVKWPEGLEWLELGLTKVSGHLPDDIRSKLKRYYGP
eukprot:g3469.t1